MTAAKVKPNRKSVFGNGSSGSYDKYKTSISKIGVVICETEGKVYCVEGSACHSQYMKAVNLRQQYPFLEDCLADIVIPFPEGMTGIKDLKTAYLDSYEFKALTMKNPIVDSWSLDFVLQYERKKAPVYTCLK